MTPLEASSHWFTEFIAPGADRPEILRFLLKELGLPCQPVDIAGNRHLILRAREGKGSFTLDSSRVILISHYDRVEISPGANDNSAAVFQLIETAMNLRKEGLENWLIIFTDKEEIPAGRGIRDQGSYTLATALRDAGLGNSLVFSFDACGTGDTLIISTTAELLLKDEAGGASAKKRHQILELRTLALETARTIPAQQTLLLPTPFSDDGGFLRAGIPAQTITVLPPEEASRLAAHLRRKPRFARALIDREALAYQDTKYIPETWRRLNGPGDVPLFLTPAHYRYVQRFACALCRNR
jgi:hypothetical protein